MLGLKMCMYITSLFYLKLQLNVVQYGTYNTTWNLTLFLRITWMQLVMLCLNMKFFSRYLKIFSKNDIKNKVEKRRILFNENSEYLEVL